MSLKKKALLAGIFILIALSGVAYHYHVLKAVEEADSQEDVQMLADAYHRWYADHQDELDEREAETADTEEWANSLFEESQKYKKWYISAEIEVVDFEYFLKSIRSGTPSSHVCKSREWVNAYLKQLCGQ